MIERVLGEKVALWLALNGPGAAAAISLGLTWWQYAAAAVGLPMAVALTGRIFGAAVARATIAESERYGATQVDEYTLDDLEM